MAEHYLKIANESATNVSSLSVTNCFTADYTLYDIRYSVTRPSGSGAATLVTRLLDNTNTEISSNDYESGQFRKLYVNTGLETSRTTGVNYLTYLGFLNVDSDNIHGTLSLANPYENDRYTLGYLSNNSRGMDSDNNWRAYIGYVGLKLNTSATGIKFYTNTDTMNFNVQISAYKAG